MFGQVWWKSSASMGCHHRSWLDCTKRADKCCWLWELLVWFCNWCRKWKSVIHEQLYHSDSFVTPPEVRRNTLVSGDNRPFSCSLCPKSFYHERDLDIHDAKVHDVRESHWRRRDLTNKLSVQFVSSCVCPICFKTCTSLAGCRTHWSRIHFDDVVCLVCNDMFASINNRDEQFCSLWLFPLFQQNSQIANLGSWAFALCMLRSCSW